MKARYLTYFSYIGTSFRSSEKIWLKDNSKHLDPLSVQGVMEMALCKFRSMNYPQVHLSSRTDGGVHALNSSAHFDLDRYGTKLFQPHDVVFGMNKFFYSNNVSITVRQCYRVADNFSARHNAIRRTYLYRIAVLKKGLELPEYYGIGSEIPIEEWKRCHFLRLPDFDIERLREGTKYLVGYHDFTTFKKFDKLNQHKHNRREIYDIIVRPGRPLITSYPDDRNTFFDYWDIEIRGRAFVHNQIRRMLGTLISVAVGKLPPEEIKLMLQVPSKHSWHNFIQCSPPHGLYLCNVEYNPDDLIYDPERGSTQGTSLDEQESDSE